MFCPNCGKENPETSRFCGGCGMKLMPAGQMYTAEGSESKAGGSSASVTEDTIPSAAGGRQDAGTGGQGAAVNGACTAVRAEGDDDLSGASGRGQGKKIAAVVILIAAAVILIVGINLVLSGTISFRSAEERWQEQYDLGENYLLELDYEQAIVAFTEAISIDENNADAYLGRAEAYLGSDIWTAAEENLYLALADYETAISIDDTRSDVFADRGDVYRALGSYEEALSDYDTALELDETLGEVYAGRGHVQYALGALEEALADYETAMEAGCADEDVFLNAAGICMEQGDYDRAAEFLEEAETVYPDSEDIRDLAEELANILEEEETRKRYRAYYDKLMEMGDEYGYASEPDGYEYSYDYSSEGLSFAKLVDFDGDGKEELVTARSILGTRSWVDDGASYCNMDSIVQVWDCDGSEAVLLFESDEFSHSWLAYLSFITFSSAEGKDYLINWDGDGDWGFYQIYGKKDGTFELLCSLVNSGDATAGEDIQYYIDDTEADGETYEKMLTQYGFYDNREMYYFAGSGFGEVRPADARDETIAWLEEYLSLSEKKSASGEKNQEETEADSLQVNMDRYSEILDLFYYGIDTIWEEYGEDGVDDVSYLWYWSYPAAESLDEAGFAFMDLDGNGIDELLVSTPGEDGLNWTSGAGFIYDMYTWQDGEIIHVLESWERDRYNLSTNGALINEGSGGASYSRTAFYQLEGADLILLEYVLYDGGTDPDNPYFYGTEEEDDDPEPISEDDARAINGKYEYQAFDLTLFSEYVPSDQAD